MTDRLRKVLEFYADPKNYQRETVDIGVGEQEIPLSEVVVREDGGQRARTALAEPDVCTWTKGDDEDWFSACGHEFYFDDHAGPGENWWEYCPFKGCGRKIEVKDD